MQYETYLFKSSKIFLQMLQNGFRNVFLHIKTVFYQSWQFVIPKSKLELYIAKEKFDSDTL